MLVGLYFWSGLDYREAHEALTLEPQLTRGGEVTTYVWQRVSITPIHLSGDGHMRSWLNLLYVSVIGVLM